MEKHIYPIPDLDKHITEAENFIQRLTDNRFDAEKWSLLWKNLRKFYIAIIPLERKWKGYKKSTGITPKKVIKKDLDTLVHGLDVDMLETESAIEWGIRSSQSMIDEFPSLLPYLVKTDFHIYLEEIGNLLDAAIDRTTHGAVMKLLREFREHPDIITIGQFSTNEMAKYCKHLRDSKPPNARDEVINYIDIYQKFCGIYEKDMILCHCLLKLKETGDRPTYEEAHPESRKLQAKINHVKSRIKSFGEVYDRDLRNARAHTEIETDSNQHTVTIYIGREKKPKSYTYEQIIFITQGMSALIISFRLLIIILSNRDWRGTKDLLQ